MSQSESTMNRRLWLKTAGLQASGLFTLGTAANLLLPGRPAFAADYRALVCICLFGGNDGMNTIVPTDNVRYNQYKAVRAGLAIPQASLLPISGTDYGLHPSLSSLKNASTAGRLAPIFNVGPLRAPLTKAAYSAAAQPASLIPLNLFSHSDQQNLWEAGTTAAQARTGWGGRASDAMGTANPVISVASNALFGLSSTAVPLVVPPPGSNYGTVELGTEAWRLQYSTTRARAAALRAIYQHAQDTDLGDAFTGIQRDSFEISARLAPIIKAQPGNSPQYAPIDSAFASLTVNGAIGTVLGQQLYQAAKLIAQNATVLGSRQIFYAQLGGFDTHAGQISGDFNQGSHADLLKQLGDAMAAFDNAMNNLGMGNAVTVFTQSDFGRTFKPNNSGGTDHGWGNHHLVLGGAVRGGATYGTYPQLDLGGADDVGLVSAEMQGRWIPSTSVSQYASTLLSWFGASENQINRVLPEISNFGSNWKLGFV